MSGLIGGLEIKLNEIKKEFFIPVFFVLIWSSGGIVSKISIGFTDPATFVFLRISLAMVIMWLVCWFLNEIRPLKRNELLHISVTGLVLQAGYQLFYFLALKKGISPGLFAIILGMQPIITALTSTATRLQWIGLVLGFAGLISIMGHSIFSHILSIESVFLSVVTLGCITAGTFLQKRLNVQLSLSLAIQFTASFVMLSITTPFLSTYTVHWSAVFVGCLLWMSVVVSIGASLALYLMIKKGKLTNVTSLFYCIPIVTSFLDYLVFNTLPTISNIGGMCLILCGLYLVNRKA